MPLSYKSLSLKQLDLNPGTISPTFAGIRYKKSEIGGFLSLLYILLFLSIIIFKSIQLFNRQQLTFEARVRKQHDLSPLNISNAGLVVILFQYDQSGISNKKIPFNKQLQYGINVTARQYQLQFLKKDNGQTNQTKHQRDVVMIPCGDINDVNFCMPKRQKSEFSYQILGRTDFVVPFNKTGIVYRRYSVIVKLCDPLNPNCKKYDRKIFAFFVFNNSAITPEALNHNDVTSYSQPRAFQSPVIFDTAYKIKSTYFIKRAIIQTYPSILPDFLPQNSQPIETQAWFYDQQKIQQIFYMPQRIDKDELFEIDIKRSAYTHTYVRKFKKFDSMLAEIFGLMALASAVIFFLYSGYNNWIFEQKVRQSLGIPFQNQSLCNYYKHVGKLIAYRLGYKKFQHQLKGQKQFQQDMDYVRLVKTLIKNKENEDYSQGKMVENQSEQSIYEYRYEKLKGSNMKLNESLVTQKSINRDSTKSHTKK